MVSSIINNEEFLYKILETVETAKEEEVNAVALEAIAKLNDRLPLCESVPWSAEGKSKSFEEFSLDSSRLPQQVHSNLYNLVIKMHVKCNPNMPKALKDFIQERYLNHSLTVPLNIIEKYNSLKGESYGICPDLLEADREDLIITCLICDIGNETHNIVSISDSLMMSFNNMSKEERKIFVNLVTDLKIDFEDLLPVLDSFSKISKGLHEEVCLNIKKLVISSSPTNKKSEVNYDKLFYWFGSGGISPSELLEKATPYFRKEDTINDKCLILNHMYSLLVDDQNIKTYDRVRVDLKIALEEQLALTKDVEDIAERFAILSVYKNIALTSGNQYQNDLAILKMAKPFIVNSGKKILSDNEIHIFKNIAFLFFGSLNKVRDNENEEICNQLEKLKVSNSSLKESYELLNFLTYLSVPKRRELLEKVEDRNLSEISNGHLRIIFYKSLLNDPSDKIEETHELISLSSPFMDPYYDERDCLEIMKAIKGLPKGRREIILKSVDALFGTYLGKYDFSTVLKNVLQVAVCIPDQGREEYIRILKEKTLGLESSKKITFCHLALQVPLDELELCSQKCLQFINTEGFNFKFMRYIFLISPKHTSHVLDLALKDLKIFSNDFFDIVSKEIPTIKEDSLDYLSKVINRGHEQPELAFFYSKIILLNLPILAIHEEHPFVQRVISVASAIDPSNSDKMNPYVLYMTLKNNTEPLLPIEYPVVDGIQLNIAKLREAGNETKLTFKDLPRIDKNQLRSQVDNLKIRDQRKLTEYLQTYVVETNLLTIEKIESLLFGPNALVGELLKLAEFDGPIKNDLYYLYCIINYIAHESAEIKPNGLSDQDERLISLAFELTQCSTGQSDALGLYYNQAVPAHLRTSSTQRQEGAIEKILKIIDSSIQNQMSEILADESLLKEIIEKPKIDQASHQTLYLKNRLHNQLGLKHTLSFDISAGILYRILLEKTTEQLLAPILKRFVPAFFIKKIQLELNALIDKNQHLLGPIGDYINTHLKVPPSEHFIPKEVTKEEYIALLQDLQKRFSINIKDIEKMDTTQLETFLDDICDDTNIYRDSAVKSFRKKADTFTLSEKSVQLLLVTSGYLKMNVKDETETASLPPAKKVKQS